MSQIRVHPLGESSLLVELESGRGRTFEPRLATLAQHLRERRDVLDAVLALGSLTVHFNPDRVDRERLAAKILQVASSRPEGLPPARLHRIPVDYTGPDLEAVAERLGLRPGKVVELHTSATYHCLMVGFVPGWGYLGGLPSQLWLPRLARPRTLVPAGSVAIAEDMTGVYPLAHPGGWHLIGTTEVPFFSPSAAEPSLLRPGDRVRFHAL